MEIVNLTPYNLVYKNSDIELIISKESTDTTNNSKFLDVYEMESGKLEILINDGNTSFNIPIFKKIIQFVDLDMKEGRYYVIDEDTVKKWVSILNDNFFNERNRVIESIFSRNDFLVVKLKTEIKKRGRKSKNKDVLNINLDDVKYIERFYFLTSFCNFVTFFNKKIEPNPEQYL